ncbi:sarcospan-like protein [Camelus ferus]|nr:sarcospan-like protein [Camelus ferus]
MCRAEQLVEMARDRGPRGAMQGKLSPSRARAAGYVSLSPTDTELVVPFRCLWVGINLKGYTRGSVKGWVCLVAYLGLFMLCVSYQVDERTCIQFAMKLLYFVLSAFGLVVCVLAVAFAAHHYAQLTQFTCGTALDSCQCKLPSSEPLSRTFVYRDVTDCASITGTFKLFLLIQMIMNLVCGLVCLLACFVMWKHRYQVFYVGVRICSPTPSESQQQKV